MRERRARLIFSAVVWVILLSLGLGWTLSSRRVRIAIAGGPAGSESFELASAIARVLQEAVPRLRGDVYETGGTTDDIQLIREARVDMATIQSDAEVDDRVQGASLYYDAYQLIVREESSVLAFADLRGLRIAVAPTDSGQNRSFWFVARHFGLDADEVIALPMSEAAADFAMIHGQVDAVFRVRTPGNRAIRKLVGKHPMRIVPISQPEALALAQPSVSAGIIPIGSYRGYPPLPPEDLTTAVLERLLVVRADLDSDIVWDLTRVLFERRANLVAATKLAGFIRPLGDAERLPYPIHAGAQLYYNREKPGFVQQNARTLSGMLYVLAVLTSALVALRTRYVRARRVRMGNYNLELMDIAEEVRRATSQEGLHAIKDRLVRILRRVVVDLEGERVTQDEFQHFSFTWQAVNTLVRDRLAQPPPASPAGVGDVASRGEP